MGEVVPVCRTAVAIFPAVTHNGDNIGAMLTEVGRFLILCVKHQRKLSNVLCLENGTIAYITFYPGSFGSVLHAILQNGADQKKNPD